MKLLKNSLMKKLIIILIALIVFNIAVPQESKAWDAAGILYKPLLSVSFGLLLTVDTTIGIMLNGASTDIEHIGRNSRIYMWSN